jgi:hypothetical protein
MTPNMTVGLWLAVFTGAVVTRVSSRCHSAKCCALLLIVAPNAGC